MRLSLHQKNNKDNFRLESKVIYPPEKTETGKSVKKAKMHHHTKKTKRSESLPAILAERKLQ